VVSALKSEDIGVGVISVFPPKGLKHAGFGGVASYSRNLVSSLADRCRLVVFADRLSDVDGAYSENGVWVHRCWSKNLFYPFQIFWSVARERSEIDVLHVHHEYFLFGGTLSAVLFPFLLCLLKLLGKPVLVTLHGVISLSVVDKEFLRDNMVGGSPFALRLGFFVLTTLIAHFADVLVVHKEFFRRALVCEYGISKDKVWVIPHGVEKPSEAIGDDKAKEALGVGGKKVLLFFGYIAGYKGVELLIDAFDFLKKDEDFVLFVAGGMHPRLKDKPKYQEYLCELKERARKVSDRIIFTGFVPEKMISIYFSAADLVIFPYKVVMSSSGPFALAVSYKKTGIASDIPASREILPSQALFDKDDPKSLAEKTETIFNTHSSKRDIAAHVEKIGTANSWDHVGLQTRKLYQQVLHEQMKSECLIDPIRHTN
jgi:glycosyltransferase involved in cell wall biosynthesis